MLQLMGFPTRKEVITYKRNKKPLILALSVKSKCNYHCLPCFIESHKANKKEIGLKEHKSAIKQIAKLGAKYITIAMAGEPFLDPAFYNPKTNSFPLIDFANKLGLYVVFFTNASLLNKRNLSVLKKRKVSIIGKLWSLNLKVRERLMKVKEDLAKYKGVMIPRGLKLLIDSGFNKVKDGKTRLGVDILVTQKNYKDIPGVVKFLLKNNVCPIIDTMAPAGGALKNYAKLKLTKKQNIWLYEKLVKILGKDFVNQEFTSGDCAIKQVGFAYDTLGNVKVCCVLNSNVGNIKRTPIKKLWFAITKYREKLPKYRKRKNFLDSCDTAKLIIKRFKKNK